MPVFKSMNQKIKIFSVQLILLLGIVWGGSVFDYGLVQANEIHGHKHKAHNNESHKPKSVSPFEKNNSNGGHVCPLMHSKDMPCPHKHYSQSLSFQISPDCGGSPLGAVPSGGSFSKEISMVTDIPHANRDLEMQNHFATSFLYLSTLPDPIKLPPKVLQTFL